MHKHWTSSEDALLTSIYPHSTKPQILARIQKPWSTVKRRAYRLGLRRSDDVVNFDRKTRSLRKDRWTAEEDALLRDIYPSLGRDEILSKINRKWKAIWCRAYAMGLRRDPEILRKEKIEIGKTSVNFIEGIWTPEEDALVRGRYEGTSREELLSMLSGRTWKAIRGRASDLGVQRNPDLVKKENVLYQSRAIRAKYGVEYTTQLPSMKEKSRQTNLQRRGVEYPTQSKEVREKVKKSVQERYGVENVFQNEEIKEKAKDSLLDKFGVTSPLKSSEIMNKVISTNEKRYGVRNPFQMVDRVQNGMLAKYGSTTPLNVPEIVERKKRTCLAKYGTEYAHQNASVREKIEKTNQERYGAPTPLLSLSVKQKIRDIIAKNGFNQSKGELIFYAILRYVDPRCEHLVIHPDLFQTIDFYMPLFDLWVQYDGVYWHGKIPPPDGTMHAESIRRTMETDAYQNECVPNLLRFWSDDVESSIKNGTILEYVEGRIEEKIGKKISVCYQYAKKLEVIEEDKKSLLFDPSIVRVEDFSLDMEGYTSEIISFINKYEWLGKVGVSPKWCFTARYQGILGGVVLINEPTAYSRILGVDTPRYEALIQRGATASWTPKNLGSRLVMFSCRWMVNNTDKRAFVGYGDPRAHEIGVIYQACNFQYMGRVFGEDFLYVHPTYKSGRVFTEHSLKRTSSFRAWCMRSNVVVKKEWFKDNGFKNLSKIPDDIKEKWAIWNYKIIHESVKIPAQKKHKYVLVIGRDKREKRVLDALKNYKSYPYPKAALLKA